MTLSEKASKIDFALKRLNDEIISDYEGYDTATAFVLDRTIRDFIEIAPDSSKALLFNILTNA